MEKNRPLLLELKNPLLKNQMTESLSKLHDANKVFKRLSIAHDMTKVERMLVKKLVDEAKEREKKEGKYMFKVRGSPENMKIVKINKH